MADVVFKYKDNTIGELTNSGTKTLLTSGKYCEANIEVVYTKPASINCYFAYEDEELDSSVGSDGDLYLVIPR